MRNKLVYQLVTFYRRFNNIIVSVNRFITNVQCDIANNAVTEEYDHILYVKRIASACLDE